MDIRQAIIVDNYREVSISLWEQQPITEFISDADYSNLMLDQSPLPDTREEVSESRAQSTAELISDLLM